MKGQGELKVAPGPLLPEAHRRRQWASTIKRQIEKSRARAARSGGKERVEQPVRVQRNAAGDSG
jgi:hypothetical protein